jgi:hypothetical protein
MLVRRMSAVCVTGTGYGAVHEVLLTEHDCFGGRELISMLVMAKWDFYFRRPALLHLENHPPIGCRASDLCGKPTRTSSASRDRIL